MHGLELHEKAIHCAKEYLRCEKELLSVLIEMDRKRVFSELGYTGVFAYGVKALGFSESQANYFSSVVRKIREVPQLKTAIDQDELTISKARRITSVITQETHQDWIHRAKTMSQKELEKKVAEVNPRAVQERVKAVSATRYELKFGITEALHQDWKRVMDLNSKKKGKNSSMEEAFEMMTRYFLDREDPIRKAERASVRSGKPAMQEKPESRQKSNQKGGPASVAGIRSRRIPHHVVHEVNLRDLGKCQIEGCENRRFVDLHHIQPFSEGGTHAAQNLTTVCSQHHNIIHRYDPGHSGQDIRPFGPFGVCKVTKS